MGCMIHCIENIKGHLVMVSMDEVAALYRDKIILLDGSIIEIAWDAYPFLDKALRDIEKRNLSKTGKDSQNVI